jgi:geranylgeranyl transferase type-2 subunit beta
MRISPSGLHQYKKRFMTELAKENHIQYIINLDGKNRDLHHLYSAHIRLNGIYWGCTALALMGALDRLERQKVIDNVMQCYHPDVGGFGGHKDHDPHILFTLSAVQTLILVDALDQLDSDAVMNYIKSLQNHDGSFSGDKWGETDTRFSYCAVSCASLLGRLNELDIQKATSYVVACQVIHLLS